MIFKCLYTLQTGWPVGRSNPEGFEAIDWEKRGAIPFVPVAGMLIDCGDGDLRKVCEVYWMVDKPDELEVNFEGDYAPRPANYCLDGGWITRDLPKKPSAKRRAKT